MKISNKAIIFSFILLFNHSAFGNFFYCNNGDILNSYVGIKTGNSIIVSGPNNYMGVGISDNHGNFFYND